MAEDSELHRSLPILTAKRASELPSDVDLIRDISHARWLALDHRDRRVAPLDDELRPGPWRALSPALAIGPSPMAWTANCAFSDDLALVAVFGSDSVTVYDESGVEFTMNLSRTDRELRDWVSTTSGAFVDDALWYVGPGPLPEAHTLTVVDVSARQIRTIASLEGMGPAGFTLLAHPDRSGAIVVGGRGQDGSDVWTAVLSGPELDIRRLERTDLTVAGVLPSGELLATPHTGEVLAIYSWPHLLHRGDITNSAVFSAPTWDGGDGFSDQGFAVSDREILMMTERGRLLLLDQHPLQPTAEVRIPGYGWEQSEDARGSAVSEPDLVSVTVVHGRQFLARHRDFQDKSVWAVPDLNR